MVFTLNGLIYKKPTKQNIFEDRKKQYALVSQTILDVLNHLGYTIDPEIHTCSSDPTNRTYACDIHAVNAEEEVQIRIPIPDKCMSFLISGNRWIPVYQFCDQPIFKRDTDVILRTASCSIYLDESLQFIKIGDKRFPVLLVLLYSMELHSVMSQLNVDYTISTDAKSNCFNILIYKDTYLNISKNLQSMALFSMFSVFDVESENLHVYNSSVIALETFTPSKLLECWNTEDKQIKNLVKLMSIPDFFILENKFFKPPFNTFSLIVYLYVNDLHIDEIEMNDINNKRIRMGEWLLTKVARQYKQGIVSNKDTLYANSIMDVMNVDQRRVFDEFINPLMELSAMSRVIYYGPEGISKESCCSELRNLSESYYGKIDPIDSPSGENIGVSQSIVVETYIEDGILKSNKEDSSNE